MYRNLLAAKNRRPSDSVAPATSHLKRCRRSAAQSYFPLYCGLTPAANSNFAAARLGQNDFNSPSDLRSLGPEP